MLIVDFVLLAILCLFGLHRVSMIIRWFKYRKHHVKSPINFTELPRITVQIPLYNERLVAKRVVDAIVLLQYPADR